MHSMTGFGQAAAENGRFRITVTLRGVNNRFLDLVLRLRDPYRDAEAGLREQLSQHLRRGRVEVTVDVEPLVPAAVSVEVHRDVVRALEAASRDLASESSVRADLGFSDLLRLPEAVRLRLQPTDWDDGERTLLREVAEQAVQQMLEARGTEGDKLYSVLEARLSKLRSLAETLKQRYQDLPAQLAADLRQRVSELLEDSMVDDVRLAQEAALLVERSDVREEVDRLGGHLEHFAELMAQEGSLGKRLDFLTQEIHRELNTMGAKCRDKTMLRSVLEAKAVCEQLREQVQNVE